MAAVEKPREHSQQLNGDFQAAQRAYLKLIALRSPNLSQSMLHPQNLNPSKAATPRLRFETVILQDSGIVTGMERAKVKGGGWSSLRDLEVSGLGGVITFYPDPNHEWDGGSLK